MKPTSTSMSIEEIMKEMTITVTVSLALNKAMKVKMWIARHLFICGAKVIGCKSLEFISKQER